MIKITPEVHIEIYAIDIKIKKIKKSEFPSPVGLEIEHLSVTSILPVFPIRGLHS
jgi:hypothetical protein